MACDKAAKPEVGRAVAPTMEAPPEAPELPKKKDVTFEPDVPQVVFDEVDDLIEPPEYHANRRHLLHPMEFGAGYYGFTRDGLMLVSAMGVATRVGMPKGVDPGALRLEAVSSTHTLWFDAKAEALIAARVADGETLWSHGLCGVPSQVTMTEATAYWKAACGQGLVSRKPLEGPGELETLPADASAQVVELCADAKGIVAAYTLSHIQWDDGEEPDSIAVLRPQRGRLCRFTRRGGSLRWISVYSGKSEGVFGQMARRVASQEGVLDPAKAPTDAAPLEPAGKLMGWDSGQVSLFVTELPYTYGDISSRAEAGREWVFSGWDIHPDDMKAVALDEYEVSASPGGAKRSPEPTSTPGYVFLARGSEAHRYDTDAHPSGVRFASGSALVWLEGGEVIKRVEW
jgi:hypothetical protein